MEKKYAQLQEFIKKHRFIIFVIIILGLLASFTIINFIFDFCGSTSFISQRNSDGTYDLGIGRYNGFAKSVTVPAEYNGERVTSFLMDAYTELEIDEDIKKITLSEGIEKVDISKLNNLPSLEKVILPSTIKYIRGSNYSDFEIEFTNNEYVYFESGCYINKATKTVTAATNYAEIPEGIEIIGETAFRRVSLKEINLPSSLKIIEGGAFYDILVPEPIDLTLSCNIEIVDSLAFAANITIENLILSTKGVINENVFGYSNKRETATIKNIVLNEMPIIASFYEIPKKADDYTVTGAFKLSIDKNGNGALRYLYVNTDMMNYFSEGMMFEEVISDRSGYKKYDYSKFKNADGFTIVIYVQSYY